MSCSKFASSSNDYIPSASFAVRASATTKTLPAKDLNFDLDVTDLAKVQRLDANRSSKLQVSDEIQQTGKLNTQKYWKRSMAEYMDARYPGETMAFDNAIPVHGLPGWQVTKTPRKNYYERTTERKKFRSVRYGDATSALPSIDSMI